MILNYMLCSKLGLAKCYFLFLFTAAHTKLQVKILTQILPLQWDLILHSKYCI